MHTGSLLDWLNFIILSLTLICIAWYLYETRRIRCASERQLEAQIAPALTLVIEGDSLYVMNVGSGVALSPRAVRTKLVSVDWEAASNFGSWLKGLPVMPSCRVDTGELVSNVGTLRGERLHLLYESLSGRGYCSIVSFEGDGTPARIDFVLRS